MNVKKIAAVFAAAAIIGSASYSLTDHFILEDVVVVSAATTLRRNSTGSEVTKLQNNLIKLNYLSKGSATGKYNAATEAAVKQFQTDYSLYADGIAGSKTLSLLSSIVSGSVKTVEVRATVLNVRYTASPAGKLLTTVKKGQKFVVEGEASESDGTKWYKIQTKYGAGYVCSDYVAVSSNASSTTPSEKKGIIKVTGNVLNVRKSATTSSKKLYTIKMGQTYYYSDVKTVEGETWYYIKVNKSISGWVLGSMVTVIPKETATTATAKTTKSTTSSDPNGGTVTVNVDQLNVREGASTSAKKVFVAKRDQVYSYSKSQKAENVEWYYIKVYVKVKPNSTATTENTTKATQATKATQSKNPDGGSVTVTVDALNVRESASTTAKKVFVVKNNQVYTYSETKKVDSDTWYHIKINNSIDGWVIGKYVKAVPNNGGDSSKETKSTTASNTGSKTLIVQADALNVRESPSTSAKKVFLAKKGQKYTYSETKTVDNATWYHIKVNNSINGWVMGTYVKEETTATTKATTASTTKETTKATTASTTKATTKATTASTTKKQTSGKLRVDVSVLNVRTEATTKSKIVTTVKKDKSYSFTNVKTVNNEKWYYITVSSAKKGWVNGGYVTVLNGEETKTTTSTTATKTTTKTTTKKTEDSSQSSGNLIIDANLLNVRLDPSSTATIIGTVKRDSVFEYSKTKTAEGITWYYINVSNVRSGWVMGTYIKVLDSNSNVRSEPKSGTLSIVGPVLSAVYGNNTYLYTNATLDLVSSAVFAATYGWGIMLGALVLFCWQGSIYAVAYFLNSSDFIPETLMAELSIVGGLLLISSGLAILNIKDCKTVNMLPALAFPVLFYIIKSFI